MERIEKLRDRALRGGRLAGAVEFNTLFFQKYDALAALPEEERYAEAFYSALSNLTVLIAEGELIVGSRAFPVSAETKKLWEEVYEPIAQQRRNLVGGGQDSHMAIDYDLLLSRGVNGIIADIDDRLQQCSEDKVAFYKGCRRCLEAVVRHSENYAEAALKLSEETADPVRREELKTIAQICKNVPARPAETFYEAVQAVHFISHCISLNPYRKGSQQFQLGHPDRYLLPYYEQDIQRGTLTREYARLLLDCLGIQINMRVANGLSSGYMVGGTDADGNTVANELTELCMQVVDDIRLVYPAVGLCYTEDMPKHLLEMACRLLANGRSHPAIFNDALIVKGLMHYGVPEREAHNYIHSTCVEITPVGASNVWVASPYTNMLQLLLDIMDREYPSYEALLAAYYDKLDEVIRLNFEEQNRKRANRAVNSMSPLLSCFVNDCLDRGLDLERGGARYNWIMPSFVGMANLVDSMYAIKTLVFEENRLTIAQMKALVDSDFADNEALRQYILNHIPKYGNDIDDVDGYFGMFIEHLLQECRKYSGMHTNGDVIPSVFCWVMHARLGKETQATPDGRKAGFPLGDGSGPCQGREMNGPTASILSSTKWDHHKLIGGVAVNLKFSKAALGAHSLETMQSLIKTYMKRGGFEVQINVVDNEVLKKARENPEEYRDLVVRIGGYSDYFVRLTPEMQQEVILRTAHSI